MKNKKAVITIIFTLLVMLLCSCKKSYVADTNGALGLKTGDYKVDITLEGGTGKVSITSPAVMKVTAGEAIAFLEWSSPNYDYMIVDGQKYLNMSEVGNSVFEVPIKALDEKISVIADTTAMSTPHEIEYNITLKLVEDDSSENKSEVYENNSESNTVYEKFEIIQNIGDDLIYDHSMEIKYAKCFSVDYYRDSKDSNVIYRLININSEGRFLFYPDSLSQTEIDNLKSVVEKVSKETAGKIELIKSPQNIYLAASQVMDYFVSINQIDRIKFSALSTNDWYIDKAKEKMTDKSIAYAGKYSAPDYELLLSGKCDLAIENTMIYHTPEVKEKLQKLGMPVVVDNSSYEDSPLGRCEWVKLYGAMLGCEEKAVQVFDDQINKVNSITNLSTNENVKTIAFFYIASNNTVKVRGSRDYFTNMIEMAGGKSVFNDYLDEKDSSATVSLQMEVFYAAAQNADYILYNSTIDDELLSINDLLKKSDFFKDFKAVKEGKVYCISKNMFQSTMEIGDVILDINKMISEREDMTFIHRVN